MLKFSKYAEQEWRFIANYEKNQIALKIETFSDSVNENYRKIGQFKSIDIVK